MDFTAYRRLGCRGLTATSPSVSTIRNQYPTDRGGLDSDQRTSSISNGARCAKGAERHAHNKQDYLRFHVALRWAKWYRKTDRQWHNRNFWTMCVAKEGKNFAFARRDRSRGVYLLDEHE